MVSVFIDEFVLEEGFSFYDCGGRVGRSYKEVDFKLLYVVWDR